MQPGMPRRVADQYGFEFAPRVNPDSSMAMGFVDQQVNASGPAQIVTFAGTNGIHFTTATPGSYFDNGSFMHFSHDIEDLYQFYSLPNQDSNRPDGEPFDERVQYMFRSNEVGTANGIPAQPKARHSSMATGVSTLSLRLPSRRPTRTGKPPSPLTPRLRSTCLRSARPSLLCP